MPEPWGGIPAGGRGRGMGRGLAAILSPGERDDEPALREIPLELIRPNPRQPRQAFDGDALLALSESIRARGLLQPIVVRPLAGGTYELVAGERRLRAAELAGMDRLPAIVRATAEAERLELALIENMAREDLNAVEEARACATLVEDLGLTKEELGRRVGRSRAAVANLIRLLDLPDEVLAMIEQGRLSGAHGKAILMCRDQDVRRRLALEAAEGGWSVRETERRAKQAEDGRARPPRAATVHPDLADALGAAEDTLSTALGHEVRVKPRGGAFRVEFEVDSPADAVALAERLLRRSVA